MKQTAMTRWSTVCAQLSVVLILGAPAAATAQASFNTSTQVLTVPTIDVDGRTFRNLQARLDADGRLTILALTAPVTASADFQECPAPKSLNPYTYAPRAVFQTIPQMLAALAGTWQGCDIYGRTVTFTVTDNSARGTISWQKNYYATYTFCTYQLSDRYRFINQGQWGLRPVSMACAEGDGLDQAAGNVFTVYVKGSPGVATELMLELDIVPFALVVKR